MDFNMGRKNECVSCKLESLSGGNNIELDYLIFRKSSADKVADIMLNGVKRENQDLVLDSLVCKKDEFKKLTKNNYKALFTTLSDIDNNKVAAVDFELGCIAFSYDTRNIRYSDNDVIIDLVSITVFPYGSCSYKTIE